jgi:hypothetical protein
VSRTVAIMQPTYLPYLGYFDLIAQADVFVLLDDVQFERKSWQQKNRVSTPGGGEAMLTVPVRKQPLQTLLRDVEIDEDKPWRSEHLAAIDAAYRGRPGFDEGWAFANDLLANGPRERLCDVTCAMIEQTAQRLGLNSEIVRASTLGCGGRRSEHVLALCQALAGDVYVSPRGAADYIAADNVFADAGFPVRYRSYAPIAYPQDEAGAFTPYLAFLDAAMNLGWTGLADHLRTIAAQPDWGAV